MKYAVEMGLDAMICFIKIGTGIQKSTGRGCTGRESMVIL
jgi:hypothetical protein